MKFDKSSALLSIFYSLGQITLGFLLHPYQTMQMVVKDRVYNWMVLLPMATLFGIILAWKNLFVPVVRMFFSCSQSGVVLCDWLPFISKIVILYSWLWQILLLYLFFRFFILFSRK
ncbi:MAG: hypothetical protein GW942_01410 [Candidatus Pacebacteria bacterium]|nr:hypothetical protein [Candidatus Paceibacterota bacterium]